MYNRRYLTAKNAIKLVLRAPKLVGTMEISYAAEIRH